MLFPASLPPLSLLLTSLLVPVTTASAAGIIPNPNLIPNQKQEPMIDTFRESCVNWHLDASTCSLTGICKLTDDSREASHPKLHGWHETSLDLNNCIWYDAKESKVKWFEVKDGKVEGLSGTANFCRDFCDCWMLDGGMSQDAMACHCDSGGQRRSRLSVLDLTEHIANGGGHFECFGRKGN